MVRYAVRKLSLNLCICMITEFCIFDLHYFGSTDDDLKLAMQLSQTMTAASGLSGAPSTQSPGANEEDEEETLQRAIQMSLSETPTKDTSNSDS